MRRAFFYAFNTTQSAGSQASTHQGHVSLPTNKDMRRGIFYLLSTWLQMCVVNHVNESLARPGPHLDGVKHTPDIKHQINFSSLKKVQQQRQNNTGSTETQTSQTSTHKHQLL